MSCIPHRGVDDLGVKGCVLVGDVSIKGHAGIVAVFRIHLACRFAPPSSAVALAVGRSSSSLAPMCSEGQTVLMVDDSGQGLGIRFIADVPCHQPRQLGRTGSRTRFRHLGQAQIGRVSQNCGEQERRVLDWFARFQMREAAGEASPAIHFQQQVRDLHMREHSIEPVPQFVGFLRNVVFQRTDLQTCAVQLHVRQLVVTRERIALIDDRLGRNLADLVRLIAELETRRIHFESLTEKIETRSPAGKLVFHVFAALAEFERNLIRERTVAGLKAARARGRKGGRPAKLSAKEIKTIRTLLKTADIPVAEIAARFGVARSTLYRAVLNREYRLSSMS